MKTKEEKEKKIKTRKEIIEKTMKGRDLKEHETRDKMIIGRQTQI